MNLRAPLPKVQDRFSSLSLSEPNENHCSSGGPFRTASSISFRYIPSSLLWCVAFAQKADWIFLFYSSWRRKRPTSEAQQYSRTETWVNHDGLHSLTYNGLYQRPRIRCRRSAIAINSEGRRSPPQLRTQAPATFNLIRFTVIFRSTNLKLSNQSSNKCSNW